MNPFTESLKHSPSWQSQLCIPGGGFSKTRNEVESEAVVLMEYLGMRQSPREGECVTLIDIRTRYLYAPRGDITFLNNWEKD